MNIHGRTEFKFKARLDEMYNYPSQYASLEVHCNYADQYLNKFGQGEIKKKPDPCDRYLRRE